MSFSMQKLRSILPGQHAAGSLNAQQRHSVSLEPEIGFQIFIEMNQQQQQQQHHTQTQQTNNTNGAAGACSTGIDDDGGGSAGTGAYHHQQKAQRNAVPQLNVHLIAARHLPALFGFKVVQGYLIKVKLFPGSKRLDSSIQTNSWPKFNEYFKFPLAPDIKPSLKHYARRDSKTISEFTPDDLFAGQFVVFTVYALLELPPASFNRFNKTYRSLRDKSSNLVQKVVESSSGKENTSNGKQDEQTQKIKRKSSETKGDPRDAIPPLTISESRRNIGSVTCYLESKLFKRNARSGIYSTDELWLPIKDITTTIAKGNNNNNNTLTNASKGVVEIALQIKDLSDNSNNDSNSNSISNGNPTVNNKCNAIEPTAVTTSRNTSMATGGGRNPQWNRITAEMKRKMGISNTLKMLRHDLVLYVTTARMRCSNKVKDELESTAGSVYVKTTVFEHGIYIDSWKSSNFYPSLSIKWDMGETATLAIPLQSADSLQHILIRTTLATKTKMGKKMVLGTVLIGANATASSGAEHMQLLCEMSTNERVPMWHNYQ